MSKYFNLVKHNYDKGLWSIGRVRKAVEQGWITEEEFAIITGQSY